MSPYKASFLYLVFELFQFVFLEWQMQGFLKMKDDKNVWQTKFLKLNDFKMFIFQNKDQTNFEDVIFIQNATISVESSRFSFEMTIPGKHNLQNTKFLKFL